MRIYDATTGTNKFQHYIMPSLVRCFVSCFYVSISILKTFLKHSMSSLQAGLFFLTGFKYHLFVLDEIFFLNSRDRWGPAGPTCCWNTLWNIIEVQHHYLYSGNFPNCGITQLTIFIIHSCLRFKISKVVSKDYQR